MIILHHPPNSDTYQLWGNDLPAIEGRSLIAAAARVLEARNGLRAAAILKFTPFELKGAVDGHNGYFQVLRAILPLERYENLRKSAESPEDVQAYQEICAVLKELGTSVYYVSIDLLHDDPEKKPERKQVGLKEIEIYKLVY